MQVGSQVSGRVAEILVDFNSEVKVWMAKEVPGWLSWEVASWLAVMPSARVDGTITMKGRTHTFAGSPGYHDHKAEYLKRLRRIEGQVRGLQRMVDEDVYCIDILTQVSAVKSALQSVSVGLVEDHLGHCVMQAIETGGPEADAKVKEASEAIARLVRS